MAEGKDPTRIKRFGSVILNVESVSLGFRVISLVQRKARLMSRVKFVVSSRGTRSVPRVGNTAKLLLIGIFLRP